MQINWDKVAKLLIYFLKEFLEKKLAKLLLIFEHIRKMLQLKLSGNNSVSKVQLGSNKTEIDVKSSVKNEKQRLL